jgi:hypothetical protein
LTLVSTLDQRIVSDDTVQAWQRILVNVNPVEAREAVEEHFRTQPDKYLNVSHVVAGAKRWRGREFERLESEARRLEEEGWVGDPIPVCAEHREKVIKCDPCCDILAHQVSHLRGDDLHRWAVANLYLPETEWATA